MSAWCDSKKAPTLVRAGLQSALSTVEVICESCRSSASVPEEEFVALNEILEGIEKRVQSIKQKLMKKPAVETSSTVEVTAKQGIVQHASAFQTQKVVLPPSSHSNDRISGEEDLGGSNDGGSDHSDDTISNSKGAQHDSLRSVNSLGRVCTNAVEGKSRRRLSDPGFLPSSYETKFDAVVSKIE